MVELDGDSHADEQAQERDDERTQYLQRHGLLVLRFWNGALAVNEDGVVCRIFEECVRRTGQPSGTEMPSGS